MSHCIMSNIDYTWSKATVNTVKLHVPHSQMTKLNALSFGGVYKNNKWQGPGVKLIASDRQAEWVTLH